MKKFCQNVRVGLMTFAFGLAFIYMWNGMQISFNTVPVDLPKISSGGNVLFVYINDTYDRQFWNHDEEEILNGRDKSLYKLGGYIEPCSYLPENETRRCSRKREAARQFVLRHWKEKRSAYIQMGHPCVDCAPTDHIFVERSSKGAWRAVITLETNGPLQTNEAANLKLRRADQEEAYRLDTKYVLAFEDQEGKEIDLF